VDDFAGQRPHHEAGRMDRATREDRSIPDAVAGSNSWALNRS
jgi:hypothetical protein